MKITLAILAAGLGSRFGSDKQLQKIHKDNILLDYSIYDAIEAGFDNVVLIIRTDIEELIKEHLKGKFESVDISFVYQDKMSPKAIERKKPWGTGHAMLCLKDKVRNPFLIINADDYYGKTGFKTMAEALRKGKENTLFSAGYRLGNTLSLNGSVSRGVCSVDKDNRLESITEATKLVRKDEKNAIDENSKEQYPLSSFVSMNFWGFTPNIFEIAEPMFADFVEKNKENAKSEFYIPTVVQQAKNKGYEIEVLPNEDSWFGMTYLEDLELARQEIKKLIEKGKYPNNI